MNPISVVRRELNRDAEARLEVMDVFNAVKDVLSKDALMSVGDITMKRKKRRKKKIKTIDAATGQSTEVEVEVDEEEPHSADASPCAQTSNASEIAKPDQPA